MSLLKKRIAVLGSTGSIGMQALEICRLHKINIEAVAAYSNVAMLAEQALEFGVKYVCIYDTSKYNELKEKLSGKKIKILTGMDGLCEIASLPDIDILLNSVVGMVGLLPTLTAIKCGTDIALANKETLVAGGNLVMKEAKRNKVKIYPVDSEHSAIFQCINGNNMKDLKKVILTASGGPFFGKTKDELQNISAEQALNHPNWSMGKKVTVDSSTLMNKGLEFIEAKWLFGLEPEQIEVIVHRQSIVHSAVEFNDGSVIAQLGVPDMRIPIQYALMGPDRPISGVSSLSLTECGSLTFEEPDTDTFTALKSCVEAIKKGGNIPAAVNAANEIAVDCFLNNKISFLKIGEIISETVENTEFSEAQSYDEIMRTDKAAREFALSKII